MKRARIRPRKRRHRKRHLKPGAPPGTLQAPPDALKSQLRLIRYNANQFEETVLPSVQDVSAHLSWNGVIWINVDGLGDVGVVEYLGRIFNIHPLSLEDVLHTDQRPKTESHPDYQFMTLRMFDLQTELRSEQLSIFVGPSFVLTFQERPGDCLEPIRNRLRTGSGRIRARGADYLSYALVDAVVDHYFPIIEQYGNRMEDLEYQVTTAPDSAAVAGIYEARHDLVSLRRTMWPVTDMLRLLAREEFAMISEDTRLYFRDCFDHSLQILDLLETYRELGTSLLDVYLSASSHQMNEVMKVLTLIATIFIPLTFIAGVYGMNFDPKASPYNMPELSWKYGYPAVLGLMAVCGLGLYFFFRRRGWLGHRNNRQEKKG